MITRIRVADHSPAGPIKIAPNAPLLGLKRVWVAALVMALRDKAGRVNFRSMTTDGVTHTLEFTHTINGEKVALAEPPAQFLARFVDAADALIVPGWWNRTLWRFSRRWVTTGVIDLDWGNGGFDRWYGVCYRAGSESGAEFVHIGFPFEAATIPP
jgi:hypothetical protein